MATSHLVKETKEVFVHDSESASTSGSEACFMRNLDGSAECSAQISLGCATCNLHVGIRLELNDGIVNLVIAMFAMTHTFTSFLAHDDIVFGSRRIRFGNDSHESFSSLGLIVNKAQQDHENHTP